MKEGKAVERAHQKIDKKRICSGMKRTGILYVFLIPAFLWVICFRILPLFGIQAAFRNYNIYAGIFQSKWVGLSNFKKLFSDERFLKVIKNTFEIGLIKLLVFFPIPIVMAFLLNEIKHANYKKFIQLVICIPHFLSFVVIHGLFKTLFSTQGGLINDIIAGLGMERINFYSNAWFRFVLVVTEIFKECGWNTIIYLAALSFVDKNLYDSARVDGASAFKQMIHISLPAVVPVIIIMLTIQLGTILVSGTEQILVMYNPSVYETADVIGTFVFREGIGSGKFSLSAAIGLFESAVSFALIFGGNSLCRKLFQRGIW